MSKQRHANPDTKHVGNGKRRKRFRDKRRSEAGSHFTATRLGDSRVLEYARSKGGRPKLKLKRVAYANVVTAKGSSRVKINEVVASGANRNFPRQNIITKGATIRTELGNAVVTNRPAREGVVNARLIE